MGVFTLKTPVTVNGKTYEALTYRRARGGDIRLLDRLGLFDLIMKMQDSIEKDEAGQPVVKEMPVGLFDKAGSFLARVTDTDEAVIDMLDGEDFMELFGKMEEILPDVPLSRRKSTTS